MSKSIEDRVRELEDAFIVVSQYMPQLSALQSEVKTLKSYFDNTCERRTKDQKLELESHVEDIDEDITTVHKRVNQVWYGLFVVFMLFVGGLTWADIKFSSISEKEISHQASEFTTMAELVVEVRAIHKSLNRIANDTMENRKELKSVNSKMIFIHAKENLK